MILTLPFGATQNAPFCPTLIHSFAHSLIHSVQYMLSVCSRPGFERCAGDTDRIRGISCTLRYLSPMTMPRSWSLGGRPNLGQLGCQGPWHCPSVPGVSRSLVLSLAAYDCDFFNKGKPIFPKWSLGGEVLPAPPCCHDSISWPWKSCDMVRGGTTLCGENSVQRPGAPRSSVSRSSCSPSLKSRPCQLPRSCSRPGQLHQEVKTPFPPICHPRAFAIALIRLMEYCLGSPEVLSGEGNCKLLFLRTAGAKPTAWLSACQIHLQI